MKRGTGEREGEGERAERRERQRQRNSTQNGVPTEALCSLKFWNPLTRHFLQKVTPPLIFFFYLQKW